MNREQKELLVNTLKQDFKSNKSSFLVSVEGITVSKVQELRKGLKASGGKLRVAKTRLMKLAVSDVTDAKDLTPYLKKQIGVVFANDSLGAAKLLFKFAKDNEKFKIIVGSLDSQIFEKSSLERIAKLPAKEVLLAQLCGVLKAPVAKLAQTVEALREKKAQSENV